MKVLNEKIFKNEEFKGQPQGVIKLHEENRTLKSTLAKSVCKIEGLDKLSRYCICLIDKFGNGYEGDIMFMMRIPLYTTFAAKLGIWRPNARINLEKVHPIHLKLIKEDLKRFGYLTKR